METHALSGAHTPYGWHTSCPVAATMRCIPQALVLSAVVLATSAHFALAAGCGDGIKQVGEQCDPGTPSSETACPGHCVPLPYVDACQCALPSDDPREFAVIADVQARLAPTATVLNGGVAVVTAGGILSLGAGAGVDPTEQAIGDRCRLLSASSVGRLFCNDALVLPDAFIDHGGPFAFIPPLTFPSLPAFTPGFGGGADVVVATGSTRYLAPGTYGTLVVESGGALFLHGIDAGSASGRYDIVGMKIIDTGVVFADNPVVVNLTESLRLTGPASLAPYPFSSVQAGDLAVNVEGRGAKLGKGATVAAHVRAPNGKISVGRGTAVRGRLIAQKVVVQKNAVVYAEGGCGDGKRATTEICDATAPNGTLACPGDCIALGEPGQCTCRCTTNADCDDQDACNGLETCDQGHCSPGVPPNCDDGNACTIDCHPSIGCVQLPKADGTACDDGDECTRSDQCLSGICTAGPPRTCNDGNDCTTDSCDPAKGCVHDALTGLACADGNACTQGDACVRGSCIAGVAVSCDDANPCTADTCDALLGCQHAPITDGVSCAGPSPCTVLDTCLAGVCIARGPQICSDGNECTTDACSPVGPLGSQTTQCTHPSVTNFTPCGPGGTKSCFNGVCL